VALAMSLAPGLQVVTGASPAMASLQRELNADGIRTERIRNSYPFHWPALSDMADQYAERLVQHVSFRPPRVPCFNSLDGKIYPDAPAGIARALAGTPYLPLQIQLQVKALISAGINCFVEVGPNATFSNIVRQVLGPGQHPVISLDSSPGRGCGVGHFLAACGQMFCLGLDPDLGALPGMGLDGTVAAPMSQIPDAEFTPGAKDMDEREYQFLMEVLRSNERIAENLASANLKALQMVFGEDARLPMARTPAMVAPPIKPAPPPPRPAAAEEPEQPAMETSSSPAKTEPSPLSRDGERPVSTSKTVDPELRAKIVGIIKAQTGYSDEVLTDNATIQDELAIDSIQVMLIVEDIKRALGVDLAQHVTPESRPETLADLISLVASLR
jgi:acyl transferase domain-containing protein